jgi:hypothetical protein
MRRWIYGREVDKASGEREDEEETTGHCGKRNGRGKPGHRAVRKGIYLIVGPLEPPPVDPMDGIV